MLGGGVKTVLYDNMRSVVLERRADAIRFHPTLLELAAHYRFEPRPVAPARGNEKGRVERLIRFVRESFFHARPFHDLHDLNAQADEWRRTRAVERPCPEDRQRTVAEVFAEERPHLHTLPEHPFPCAERVAVSVGKTPYVRFDANDYSVPHPYVGRTLVVSATLDTVRILDADTVLASHSRSFDRGQQIEDPAHVDALVRDKHAARTHRATDRLHHAAPSTQALFAAAAQRHHHLGVLARGLIELLNAHGPAALERAVACALDADTPHLAGVRHLIDQHRQHARKPPPLPLALPDDPRLRALSVRPHDQRLLHYVCAALSARRVHLQRILVAFPLTSVAPIGSDFRPRGVSCQRKVLSMSRAVSDGVRSKCLRMRVTKRAPRSAVTGKQEARRARQSRGAMTGYRRKSTRRYRPEGRRT